ncbi:hypothetical protein PV327_003940 [Microctonus hyperodae]|uniref:Uncharacterized protein n=1 Tax=Microctonus hyperodae TaxID=165561 RepID=A0AA39L1K6_MICHY|nr:hypothetical protein PV327_003940 [Microctonus hyperodae]
MRSERRGGLLLAGNDETDGLLQDGRTRIATFVLRSLSFPLALGFALALSSELERRRASMSHRKRDEVKISKDTRALMKCGHYWVRDKT